MSKKFSIVWIDDNSRYTYTPGDFSDELILNEAVHLGCYPGADPKINGHLILVPIENLQQLCKIMSHYGQDAYQRVDSNGVSYLTDNAGKDWYSSRSCSGKDENSNYHGPLNALMALCKRSKNLGSWDLERRE